MLNKITLALALVFSITTAQAAEVPITGNVASKCTIHTDTAGIYGNPTANVMSTDPSDGGAPAIIRYDVVSANAYKAVITVPNSFLSSPSLSDTLAWTGDVAVNSVTDPNMAAYDANKRTYGNINEFDLTVAGTVWFKANSRIEYGYNKSLPGGVYKAIISAECIAL